MHSYDGRYLAFTSDDGFGISAQITSVPSNAAAIDPDFSPDRQWIVYTLVTSKREVLNMTDITTYNFTSDIYKQSRASPAAPQSS